MEDYMETEKYCYAILSENDKKYLIDLKKVHSMIDVTEYSEELVHKLVNYMIEKHEYVGMITRDDLPVIMVIMNDFERKNYNYTGENVGEELVKAKSIYSATDLGKQFSIYTDFDPEYKLDCLEKQNYMTEEEYLREKFKLVIFKLKRVEEYFLSLSPSEQELFIDEYYKISSYSEHKSFGETCSHFRTSSPVINFAVLKKEFTKEEA